MKSIAILALLSLVCLASGAEVILDLKSGRIVHGDLVSSDDRKVVVKETKMGSKGRLSSVVSYDRADIASIKDPGEVRADYAKRAAAAPAAAGDQASLAAWCADRGLHDEAIAHALAGVGKDAANPVAAKVLAGEGMVFAEGSWQDEAAYLERTGQERYDGRLMRSSEAAKLKEAAREASAVAVAQQEVDQKSASVAALEKTVASMRERIAAIPKESTALDKQIAATETVRKRCDQATAEVAKAEQAQKKTAAASGATRQQKADDAATVDRLRLAATDAKREWTKAQGDVAHAYEKKATLAQELETAQKKLEQALVSVKRAQSGFDEAKKALAAVQARIKDKEKDMAATPSAP